MPAIDNVITAIVVPIVFALATAALESVTALVRGYVKRGRGEQRFRIWTRELQDGDTYIVSSSSHQTLDQVRIKIGVIDVDKMVSFDLGDFSRIGINLVMGAFALDVASLIGSQTNSTVVGYVLLTHLIVLIVVMLFVMLNQHADPDDKKQKRATSMVSIVFGILAMAISILIL